MRAARKGAEQLDRVGARLGGPEGDATRLLADAGEPAALARPETADIAENTKALRWPFGTGGSRLQPLRAIPRSGA